MPTRLLISLLLVAAPCGLLAKDALGELQRYAKANAQLFPSEARSTVTSVTLRVPSSRSDFLDVRLAKYDPESGEMRWPFSQSLSGLIASEACRSKGSYKGANAMGVTRVVHVQECSRLRLLDSEGGLELTDSLDCTDVAPLGFAAPGDSDYAKQKELACSQSGIRYFGLKVTPSQYRAAKASGFILEYTFAPGAGVKTELVEQNQERFKPTIDYPFERNTAEARVFGRFESLAILTADGKHELARFTRQ